jgi:hypothetical protein
MIMPNPHHSSKLAFPIVLMVAEYMPLCWPQIYSISWQVKKAKKVDSVQRKILFISTFNTGNSCQGRASFFAGATLEHEHNI